jgi:hypothetical protein
VVLTELHPVLLPCWAFADQIREDLLAAIRPMSPAQWSVRAGPGSWSIAQVVDHLLRAEIGTSKMARKLIRGDYTAWRMPADATFYTAELDLYPYGQLTAPPELNPGPARDQAELERELGIAHARFRKELEQFRGEDPETLRSPDPATGIWYTLGGWVKLQAWHEAHHICQIQRIQATLHRPG